MAQAPTFSEQQLLAALARGEEAAFDTLFVRYYPGMLRYAKGLLPYPTDVAEDVTAEIFFSLWANKAQVVVQESVAAYLYTALKNRCYDRLRQQRRNAQGLEVIDDNNLREDTAHYEQPDQLLTYQELQLCVQHLIEQLSPRARQVFQLHRDGGLTYEQIAALLDISLNSVKTHMFRAMQFLRDALQVSGVL